MKKGRYFYFGRELCAQANRCLNNDTIKDIWRGCCSYCGTLSIFCCDGFCFTAGEAGYIQIPQNSEYIVSVRDGGVFVGAVNSKALARAMMVLMMRIETVSADEGEERFRIAECEIKSGYTVETRMIHFCVFPETTYSFIKKSIRLAGLMQYTHVVLEFWGTLRFDCQRALSWPSAFTKEQAAELGREIKEMGMDVIPMFNHLGHASACRVSGGKHVVLDQDPRLCTLFSPDGWSWNIESEKTKALLTRVRRELYDLFPHSEYFHLGCDEVYSYGTDEDNQQKMREYLVSIVQTVHSEGKKPIIWGDMLLNHEMLGLGNEYFCNCDTPENSEKLISALPRYTIIADWHYDNTDIPVKTSLYLKDRGFEVMGTPWFLYDNCLAHAKTVQEYGLAGIIVTTWHTLAQQMAQIVYDAIICGAKHSLWAGESRNQLETETAALLRKLCFVDGDYTEAGWTDNQVFKQARAAI